MTLVGLFLLQTPAFAAELAEITVREETDRSRETVSGENLEQRQASDLEDALRHTPDVIVGGGQRAAQKVYVRGLEDTNLNVTVDGARQTGYLFHHQGRLNIDVELMKRIDVEGGTGDALAGPGALGGALRFETKDAEDLLEPGQRIGALLKAKYHSAADEKGLSVGLFGRPTDKTGVLLYGNFLDAMDYKAGGDFGRVGYTGAKPKGGLAKLSYRPTENQKLSLSAVLREDNARRLLRAHFGNTPGAAANEQKFETQTYSANYQYSPGNPWLNLKANAYHSTTAIEQNRITSTSGAEGSSYGATVSNTLEQGALAVTTGLDYNREKVSGTNAVRSNGEAADIYGLFAQGQYRLTSAWTVGAGARFDRYSLTDVAGQKNSNQRVNPNLRSRYQLSSTFGLRAGWTQSFRGAVPMEGLVMAGATGVAPLAGEIRGTVSTTTEAGADYVNGDWKAELVAYTTKIDDPIDASVNGASLVQRRNAQAIRSKGFNASLGHRWNNLESRLSYAHNVVKFGDQPLGYTAFNRGNSFGDRIILGLDYTLPRQRILLSWNSLVALKLDRVPAGRPPQAGYAVHDFMLTYLATDRIRLSAAVHNIFDKLYVAQGTPYALGGGVVNPLYEAGRDVRLAAGVTF